MGSDSRWSGLAACRLHGRADRRVRSLLHTLVAYVRHRQRRRHQTSAPSGGAGRMNDTDLAGLLRDAMLVMLKLGGPPMMVALVVGLVISLVQAITQIHEVTISFVPKVLAIGMTLLLMGPFT